MNVMAFVLNRVAISGSDWFIINLEHVKIFTISWKNRFEVNASEHVFLRRQRSMPECRWKNVPHISHVVRRLIQLHFIFSIGLRYTIGSPMGITIERIQNHIQCDCSTGRRYSRLFIDAVQRWLWMVRYDFAHFEETRNRFFNWTPTRGSVKGSQRRGRRNLLNWFH